MDKQGNYEPITQKTMRRIDVRGPNYDNGLAVCGGLAMRQYHKEIAKLPERR